MNEKKQLKIGIDLLFVKPKKMGGVESFVKNLLQGFLELSPSNIRFFLITAQNNYNLFQSFELQNPQLFTCLPTKINSEHVALRILWENFFLNKISRSLRLDLVYVPVYSKPLWIDEKVPYVITIHDLQALHYPEHFSMIKNLWLRFAWRRCAKTATRIVAISNFVKQDIVERLGISQSKIKVIYNPIILSKKAEDFSKLAQRYNITRKNYLYTVSSLLPHKNLLTLIRLMKLLKEKPIDRVPSKLVISGVGGKSKLEVKKMIEELDIQDNVVFTGYVTDEVRDSLYANAYAFLFPSLFEGFGMPPIEAMMLGIPVITTKCASIPEVTKGKAFYVTNPFDIEEWYEKIKLVRTANREPLDFPVDFPEYDIRIVVNNYIELFASLLANNLKYGGYIHGQN